MNWRPPTLALLCALPLGLAAHAAPRGSWTRLAGAPARMATWSMLWLDATGQGSPQLYSVTHAGPASGWRWQDGAFQELETTPWGDVKGDRHAVTPCDVDRDGDLDLLQAWGGGNGAGGKGARILLREGEGYRRVFIPGTNALRMRGASCLDLESDGTVEVYLPGHGSAAPDQLVSVVVQPDGTLDFIDRAPELGLDRGVSTYGGLFGDLDGDGDLDLLRLQDGGALVLLQGSSGRFEPAPWQPDQKRVRDIALEDFNGDGHLDILLGRAGYFGDAAGDGAAFLRLKDGDVDNLVWQVPEGCTLIRAEANGTFDGGPAKITLPDGSANKRAYLRLDQPQLDQPADAQGLLLWTLPEANLLHLSAMGVSGRVQLAIDCPKQQSIRPTLVHADIDTRKAMEVRDRLYLGDGQGGFTEAPLPDAVAELETQDLLPIDVDLDGDLDLFIVTENAPGTYDNQPDLLLLNDGQGAFSPAPGFPSDGPQEDLYGRSALPLDLNGDGYPELLVSNGEYLGPLEGTPALWQNPGGANHWLQVQPLDADGHPSLHARVQVEAGELWQQRSSNPFPDFRVHSQGLSNTFGVGDARRARVVVEWPDGSRRVLRRVSVDQVVMVEHP